MKLACLVETSAVPRRRPLLPAASMSRPAESSGGFVKTDPAAAGEKARGWGARFDRLLVHVDVDVLSFVDFPIADNTRRADGLTLEQLTTALRPILASPGWRAITITEVNPDHAPDEAESFAELIDALCSAIP